MTETLIQPLSQALGEGQLQPILWVGKARSQLLSSHAVTSLFDLRIHTSLSITGKALEGAESWRCTRDQGEQTEPEPGLKPTTPLLVSATGPLEPLSTGELLAGYSGRVVCISMVTGTVWERRLKGGQMERLFGLQGGICGASRVQTKVDWAPEVKTHLPQGEEDSLTW